ncbi:MAG: ABC transporter substrate-binding protein [Oligoflexia bacterium]|nr:ABC transporter substrate-binding protein [Oligoflexia bacterium]
MLAPIIMLKKQASLLILSTLLWGPQVSAEHPPTPKKCKIAVLTELTGAGAALGAECKNGALIAIEAQTARPVGAQRGCVPELVFGDTQDDVKAAVNEFRSVILDPAVYAVVVSRSKTAMPLNPLSESSQVPLFASAAHPLLLSGNKYALRAYISADTEGSFLAAYAAKLNLKTFSTVTIEDEWNTALTAAFDKKLKELGGSVLAEDTLVPTEQDFGATIGKLLKAKPQAIFMNLQLAQAGPFLRRLRDLGGNSAVLSNYWVQKPEVLRAAGDAAVEGVRFGEIDYAQPRFVSAARQHADNVTAGTYICYVATTAAIDSFSLVSGEITRQSYSETIDKLRAVELLDGVLPVRDREIQYPLVAREIKHSSVVTVGGLN